MNISNYRTYRIMNVNFVLNSLHDSITCAKLRIKICTWSVSKPFSCNRSSRTGTRPSLPANSAESSAKGDLMLILNRKLNLLKRCWLTSSKHAIYESFSLSRYWNIVTLYELFLCCPQLLEIFLLTLI